MSGGQVGLLSILLGVSFVFGSFIGAMLGDAADAVLAKHDKESK